MIWMFLLAVVMGFVFFKLGVLTVMFALLQGLLKLLFVLSGLLLVVTVWRGIRRRRNARGACRSGSRNYGGIEERDAASAVVRCGRCLGSRYSAAFAEAMRRLRYSS